MNFLLMEMTHLRYWMPLIIEGNKRKIQSTFYVGPSYKYNCPSRYESLLRKLAQKYNINILPISTAKNARGLLFSSEKTGLNFLKEADMAKKVVCTYQTDFIECHTQYNDIADHILMPSKFCAEYYDLPSDKNLFLGIPKYDVKIDKSKVFEKYSLSADKRYVTIIAPKKRDQNAVNLSLLLSYLHQINYTILFKTRGKDPADDAWKEMLNRAGHHCFTDDSWYPHTTQELLEISDLAVNFGSTTIEECIMQDVPLINFDVKPQFRNGSKRPYRITHDYLYNYDYCIEMYDKKGGGLPTEQAFRAGVSHLTTTDFSAEFQKARQTHLFDHKDSCKRIIDVLLYQV